MGEVSKQATPVSTLDAAQVILKLAPSSFPGLSAEGAALILAHLWFETKNGKSLFNFNPGNILAGVFREGKEVISWPGDFRRPVWFNEPESKRHAQMLKGDVPSAFRSYNTLVEGVTDYLQLVNKRDALNKAILAANPHAFARGVRSSKYTPQAPQSMGNSLSSMMDGFRASNIFGSLPQQVTNKGATLVLFGTIGALFWLGMKK